MPRETFESALEGLVEKIAKEASADGVKLADRVDALKALTTYYIGDSKLKRGQDDEDDEADTGKKPFSFDRSRKKIQAVGA